AAALRLPPSPGPEQKCRSGPVDLLFLIDSSRSVRPHEFETMRRFMIDILNTLDIGLNSTRVGVVQYSSQVRSEFSLRSHASLDSMVKAIQEMVPLAQGTMTGLAIRYTMNVAFTAAEGDRPKVPNVVVIVTDGRPQDRVAEVAAEARERGMEIYAVGVARADMTSLRAMASPPFEDHVFLVESFDLIHQFGLQFQDKLCGADLCVESDHGCEQVCESSPGSFRCLCLPGFTLNHDGKTCSAIDLCSEGKHDCQQICVSSPGSFTCGCGPGFRLNQDQKTCTNITSPSNRQQPLATPTSAPLLKLAVFLAMTESELRNRSLCASRRLTEACNANVATGVYLHTSKLQRQKCTFSAPPSVIDYCSHGNHSCDHECVSVLSGYHCQCNHGYRLLDNGWTCRAIDLCSEGKHDCQQICVSSPGSFTCGCGPGFRLNQDQKTCTDVDLCNSLDHGCEHQCVNTPGSFYCACADGRSLQEDGKSCGTCKSANIDLVLLIDGSKSVRPQNFELVKKFVNQVVDSLDVSPQGTRVGLVQYSSRVRTEFPLSMYHSAQEIKAAVMKVEYMEKGTMTGLALKHMLENSFSEAEGARPARRHVPRIGLVFTDGRSQDDISEHARKAKEAGITMYAVGVGKAVEEELREIASDPVEKHSYYSADFTTISTIAENLKLNVCPEESQGELEVKDPCACDRLVEFQQATMSSLEQLGALTRGPLAGMTSRLEQLEKQLL
uniref:Matrilin 4 n=1 Tax=Tetraodon nigroviridis TaxID=99883 RepID=H3BWE5_TETNG